jgi:hypothetical protein
MRPPARLVLLAAVAALPACIAVPVPAPTPASAVQPAAVATPAPTPTPGMHFLVDTLEVLAGEKLFVSEFVRDEKDQKPVVTILRSSDDSVAAVSPAGQLVAYRPGETTVTSEDMYRAGTTKGSLRVHVGTSLERLARRVVVTPAAVTIPKLGRETLKAVVTLQDGTTNDALLWSSSDDTVATINATNGVVTGLKPGEVTIVARYAFEPSFIGLARVTVEEAR